MAATATPEVGPVDRPPSPLVLCVDDEPAVLASLRRCLRGEPYEVVTASNAAQALASLRKRPFHVIISDERMPDVRGSELLAEVRERWPVTGRVILTGHTGHSVIIRGYRAGVDCLLYKPWDDDALRTTIRKMVDKAERSRGEPPGRAPSEQDFDVGGEGG